MQEYGSKQSGKQYLQYFKPKLLCGVLAGLKGVSLAEGHC